MIDSNDRYLFRHSPLAEDRFKPLTQCSMVTIGIGDGTWTRTRDLEIMILLLYQLSYTVFGGG